MLEVVIGNRLRDVSRAVISKIEVTDNLEPENFIIVPDRFSLLAEKMIFEELGIISTFNIQVLGISQLAKKILENKNLEFEYLSPNDCKLLLLNVLKKQNDIKSFKNINYILVDEIYKIISQLKSNNINCEEFKTSILYKNDEKLEDIAKIYEDYQKVIGDKVDQNDLLTKFSQAIDKDLNYNYFFVEFNSLTEQGGLVLEKLIKFAKRVVVGATKVDRQKNAYLYDDDILLKINKICRENKINAQKTYVKNNINGKQEHILKNFYGFSPQKIENKDIYFMQFATPEDEIGNIAKIINFKIKCKNRFNDFNILTTDLKSKQNLFEKVFSSYNIPFFIDSGIYAEETNSVRFIFSMLEFLIEENKDLFLSLIKNEYSQIEFSESCEIENYLNKIGNFNLNDISAKFSEKTKSFISNLLNIKTKLEKAQICKDFVQLSRDIIKGFDIELITQKLIINFKQKKELKLEKIYMQIHKKIDDVLELLEKRVECAIDFKEYIEIFKEILNDKEIYSIPASVDCVFIGDSAKSYFEERESLFIVGASQGTLPVQMKDYSILSDNDIEKLAEKVKIDPTIKMINKRNKFKIYQDITLAKSDIFVSYSSTALGEKTEPASLINELKKIFTKDEKEISTINSFFEEIAKEDLGKKKSYLDIQSKNDFEKELVYLINNKDLSVEQLKSIIDIKEITFFDENLKNEIDNASGENLVVDVIANYLSPNRTEKITNAKELFFYKNKISASQIEKFYQCPFKHFISYGLKLKENEICSFDGRDIGNYFHAVSQNFVQRNAEKIGQMSDEQVERELVAILNIVYQNERFERLSNCLENRHMVAKLKKESKMLLNGINYEQKWSEFVIKFVEKGFGHLIEETNFKLTGYVDRVDVSDEYFRIVDYKSGEVNQSLAGVYYGIELQLFIYMIAMQAELGLNPAGGFYLPVGSDFANNKALKKMILTGFVLADNSILKKLDKRFNKQKLNSDIIAIKLSAKSENDILVCSTKKNIFSSEGLDATLYYVNLLIKKSIEEISSGNILASPLKAKSKIACSNCPYFSICSFKGEDHKGIPRQEEKELTETDFIRIIKGKKDVE
ncbi:MAG: PD-(D/E)XK nuclease family protein [Clostridia bacterium]|nr:PD-(D/E)XK nuclease family protein [Clostridia bacterium]